MSPRRGLGIDAAAPSLLVDSVLKTGKMAQDMQWRSCIVRENKNLLRKINQIYRNKLPGAPELAFGEPETNGTSY
ncbi:uncharacterized protein LOC118463458 isoform X3 [Anopheles albimanus]|uniref:uncharacterized protein LOC118463458 isoform X3 n=1 Tax=Anopheles albimanus TaxID=7167 RepID=UPI00163F4424|nr:uncharacterized protein LOC118463458 isoform X3 [Anopheles albimanus]